MKVLFIDYYPAPYRAEQYNLISKHVDLTVVYGVQNDTTRNVNYKFDDKKYNVIYLNGIRIGTTSSISFKIKKIIKQGNFDVVLVCGYNDPMAMIAMRYLKKHNIPFLLNADGGYINENESKLKKKIKTYFISMANAWLTSGDYSIKYLEYYGANNDNIYKYPFAFNYRSERHLPTKEEKQALKEKLNIKEKFAILYVGRMLPVKNFDIILHAYSKLDIDAGLYVAGVDELPEEYKEIIAKKNIKNVHVLGFKNKEELKELYTACDTFVLVSKSEAWGLVVNEALTNSCPTIVSDTIIVGKELISNNENGIVVKEGSIEELTNALELLNNDESLRESLSINAYKTMAEFNIENSAECYVDIINDFYNKFVQNK